MIVYYDFETDDNKPESCNGIQFAAGAYKPLENPTMDGYHLKTLDEIELKIQFDESKANPESLKVNSYDPEVWAAEAVTPQEAVAKIYGFFNKFKTVRQISRRGKPYYVTQTAGHNAAGFDFMVLLRLFRQFDQFLPVSFDVLDTLRLASWLKYAGLLPGEPENLKLGTLCDLFNIESSGAHDALEDVRMNAELGYRMNEILLRAKQND